VDPLRYPFKTQECLNYRNLEFETMETNNTDPRFRGLDGACDYSAAAASVDGKYRRDYVVPAPRGRTHQYRLAR